MTRDPSHNILFEMLHSFVTLSKTLNLSMAVKQLGSTRQTVKRHISILEKAKGYPLFELVDRRYQLTEDGARSLKEAENILFRGEAWLAGNSDHADGLEFIRQDGNQGHSYYSQQHKMNRLWSDGPLLLQQGFDCWSAAHGAIESSKMAPVRPYLLIYRPNGNQWHCTEIGEKSAYSIWLGWEWVKSSIGLPAHETAVDLQSYNYIERAYSDIINQGGVRLDHVYRKASRKNGEAPTSVTFQRLLFSCIFPDGSPAIGSLIAMSNNIDIPGLDSKAAASMPNSLLSEFTSKLSISTK